MQLPSHGPCGYSAIVNRPDYSWLGSEFSPIHADASKLDLKRHWRWTIRVCEPNLRIRGRNRR